MLWDSLLATLAFLLAHQLRSHLLPLLLPQLFPTGLYPLAQYLPLLALVLPLWAGLSLAFPAGLPGLRVSLGREVAAAWRTVALGVMVLAAVGYLFRLQFISRPFLLLFGLLNGALLSVSRLVERKTALGRKLLLGPERVVVIVGTSQAAARLARLLQQHQAWGFRLLGFVGLEAGARSPVRGLPVVTEVHRLPEFVQETVVDEVMVALPLSQLGKLENTFARCQEMGLRVRVVLSPFPHLKPRVEVEPLGDQALLTLAPSPISPLPLFFKRVMDVTVAGLGLALFAPLLPLLALAVKLDSPGPVFFRQQRCGLRGRRFVLYKLRTMVEGAEELKPHLAHLNVMDGPVFKAPNDPRVTRVGRWLRRFSLDELPQLWNVLKGDMSLVGPRPPLPEEVARYEPWQRRRLAMKPGLTCLWQVSGRTELSFRQWMALDLAYIDSWSLALDLKILAKTLPAVLRGKGAA
ncbi:MAG: sugar transferase [Thermoanaerobaculum sp.]|nr:sugar transferase [Thermoanaerobaculum sp.]